MKELKEISSNYAMDRSNDLFSQVVAQAYADGYRQGYKDREDEIPVDLRDKKTEFVDLGLPSGTMWAKEFEQDGNKVQYLSYCDASTLSLPTEEQWNELLSFCRWKFTKVTNYHSKYDCIGPNGNVITFESYGFHKIDEIEEEERIYFWLRDSSEEPERKLVHMFYNRGEIKTISKSFMGFKYPVRLVQIKKEK